MRLTRFLSITAMAAGLAFSGSRAADAGDGTFAKPLGVVELFTSQGCNSCPPADAALRKLAARGDVVALGYHVDYWDYLGWSDTLGSKANTERQYAYARGLKRRGVYTPQAVINGRAHTNGGRYREIVAAMEQDMAAARGPAIGVKLTDLGDRIHVETEGTAGGDAGKVHIVLVYFRRHSEVDIKRGENAGRTIGYVNAVVDYQTIGMWEGAPLTVDIPHSELAAKNADGCAVLLQKATSGGDPGEIIGAAILPRQTS
ncbi:MAG: thioredoxin family protein [Oricola sp.]